MQDILYMWDQGILSKQEWAKAQKQLAGRATIGRIGEPEDIANAVPSWLRRIQAGLLGQELMVDGGRMDYIGHG